jgi:hypothetical protein
MIRRTVLFATLAAAALAGPGGARAETLPANSEAVTTVAGAWDIAGPRQNMMRCRVQLAVLKPRNREPKLEFRLPAGCRQAYQTLTRVVSWALTRQGAIILLGAKSAEIASFSRADEGKLRARIGNEDYTMEPATGGRYPSAERMASVDAAVNRLARPDVDDPRTPMKVAGSYVVERVKGQPVACTLTLDRGTPGPASAPGSGKASIDRACADKGLQVFEPVGWIVERDRLFLIARKGHRQGFNIERDGALVKDPPAGAPMFARKKAAGVS